MQQVFPSRPWVRRAGASIVLIAAATTGAMLVALGLVRTARYGWLAEPFAWLYVGTLWAGGLKIWLGTRRPLAEIATGEIVLRPLHLLRERRIPWSAVLGTEQMVPGDRLIVYYLGRRGMRFVAVNLNLIKGRRPFQTALDDRLTALGFRERVEGSSRRMVRSLDVPAEERRD